MLARFFLCLLSIAAVATAACAAGDRPRLARGTAAPDFALPGTDGKTHSLSDSLGKKAVILAWFPKAFTGG